MCLLFQVARALAMEGTCTGEHGVGVGKKAYLESEVGPEAISMMRGMPPKRKLIERLCVVRPSNPIRCLALRSEAAV